MSLTSEMERKREKGEGRGERGRGRRERGERREEKGERRVALFVCSTECLVMYFQRIMPRGCASFMLQVRYTRVEGLNCGLFPPQPIADLRVNTFIAAWLKRAFRAASRPSPFEPQSPESSIEDLVSGIFFHRS